MEKNMTNNSQVLIESLSIPEKLSYFNENDKNNYEVLAKKFREKKIKHIVTVARGTSDCAALFVSYVFAKNLGLTTYSLPPSLITLENATFDFKNTLVILITQSGLSQDLITCESAVKTMGAETLVITNNFKSGLIYSGTYVYDINAGEEKSIAATKTFVLTLAIITKLISTILLKKNIFKHLLELPAHLQKEVNNNWDHEIINQNISRGFIISRGIGFALSNEISLKFKELCQEQIEPYSSAEVMHGPKSLIDNTFKVFTLSLNDLSGKSVNKDTNKLKQKTNHLYDITSNTQFSDRLLFKKNKSPELDPLIVMTKFYPWIIKYSLAKGMDPDNPRYLSKVTKTF
tara:strand:+ start:1742 stop:2779 length:1038 start_codon:yes stop_codon:yes gene_type:complete